MEYGHELRGAKLFPTDVAPEIDRMEELTQSRLSREIERKRRFVTLGWCNGEEVEFPDQSTVCLRMDWRYHIPK